MPMIVKVVDEASPFLEKVADENPRYIRRAIRSSGWMMQKEIKTGIESGAPGGEPYEPFAPFKSLRRLKRPKHSKVRKAFKPKDRKNPLGRLKQAVRYKYYGDSARVVVGWVSKTAEHLGTLHEQGGKIKITPRMRRLYWAAGIPLGSKTTLPIPARPTIGPEYRQHSPQIPGYVEQKVVGYLEEAEQATKAKVT